ncbi:MAG: hypothetical protein EXS05_14890, partial [Planctomycetaceae bacterium]|nr:hypothetical protein [Planctomycetaceae bacterium]
MPTAPRDVNYLPGPDRADRDHPDYETVGIRDANWLRKAGCLVVGPPGTTGTAGGTAKAAPDRPAAPPADAGCSPPSGAIQSPKPDAGQSPTASAGDAKPPIDPNSLEAAWEEIRQNRAERARNPLWRDGPLGFPPDVRFDVPYACYAGLDFKEADPLAIERRKA